MAVTAGTQVSGTELQNAWMSKHENTTTAGTPPPGSIPTPQGGNSSNKVGPDVAGIYTDQYTAAYGYVDKGYYYNLYSARTTMHYSGTATMLSSETLSGGLAIHISDKSYPQDYLVMLWTDFTPSGYTSIAYAAYAGCTSVVNACGPAFSNCGPPCTKLVKLTSGSVSDIGGLNDNVTLVIHWDSNLGGTGVGGYVFDYQDTANNPYYWTVMDLCPQPSGQSFCASTPTISTMQTDALKFGSDNCAVDGGLVCVDNSPTYQADFFQVGFLFSGTPPQTSWKMTATDTMYTNASGGGGGSTGYMNHASEIYWDSRGNIYSYWKEYYVVSLYSAAYNDVDMYGSGSSTSNTLYVEYTGSQQSNYQIW